MIKELYIHVGAGKTGTTAIQEFLLLNEKNLLQEGIHMPVIGRSPSESVISHHKLAAYELIRNQKKTDDILKLWEQFKSIKQSKLLITSENFHSIIKFQNGFDYLLRIKNVLSNFRINIIFYVRREDEWFQSAYIEWVKSGSLRNGVDIHEAIKKKRNSLPEQIMAFAKIFNKESIIVRPFEKKQLFEGNIFADFLNIFKISLTKEYVLPLKNINPGITNDALDFKRIFNTICQDKNEALMLMKPLMDYSSIIDKNHSEIFTKKNLLSQEEREYILKPLMPLYSKIAKEILKREDGTLFYDLDTSSGADDFYNGDNSRVIAFLLKELFRENAILKKEIKELKTILKNSK